MEFKKQVIDDIFKCYAVSAINKSGEINLIFAGEGDGSCHIYSGNDFSKKDTIWNGGGGTMSIVPLENGNFLASQGFYSMIDAKDSRVVLVNNKLKTEVIAELPYLHRFDILKGGEKNYFLGATLSSGKETKEDWSKPGKLFVSELHNNIGESNKLKLTILKEGLTKNHGYSKGYSDGKQAGFIGAEEGLFVVIPPQNNDSGWEIKQLLDFPVSDVAVIDIDEDGEDELAIIEPFHGNKFNIYKKIAGNYTKVYSYDIEMDFYHAVFATTIKNKPAIIGGARRNQQQLFCITFENNSFKSYVIDENVGPSNVYSIKIDDRDVIMSANREIGQAAIYWIL